ncbi:MAG: metallophosphoesterase [Alphaproteobacteria bacterium]|nr:metallophosphoesterase [Alphaproteobacteria bacterium]
MTDTNKNINIFALTDCHQEARKLCALFSQIKENTFERGKNTLICDCGDLFKGIYDRQICVDSYLKLRSSLPEAKIVLALGNNDFGFNQEGLNFLINTASVFNKANIHVLCANLFEDGSNKRPKWVDPYILLEINGRKFMVMSFCINYIKLQKFKLKLSDIAETFAGLTETIKHISPDALIVLNHSTYDSSLKISELAEKAGINIDLIIGGHEHSPIEPNAEKHIYYPQAFSKNMLKFIYNTGEKNVKYSAEFLSKGIKLAAEYSAEIEEYEKKSGLNIEVAKTQLIWKRDIPTLARSELLLQTR